MSNNNFKTKWFTAYKDDKPAVEILKASKNQTGVYLIKDKNNNIVYVGFSASNLYKTFYRHFQIWNDKTHPEKRNVYPRNYKARIIITTEKRAFLLEKYLILKLKPRDNNFKYEDYLTPKEETQVSQFWNGLEVAPF